MKDNDIITDIQANKVAINKLMLHFADNTISYLDVTYKEDFKITQIAEYSVAGKPLYLYARAAFYLTIQKWPIRSLADLARGWIWPQKPWEKSLALRQMLQFDPLYLDKEFEKLRPISVNISVKY